MIMKQNKELTIINFMDKLQFNYTPAVIEFDENVFIAEIDKLDLDAITPAKIKEFKDKIIKKHKELSHEATEWRAKADRIIEHLDKRIEHLREAKRLENEKYKKDKQEQWNKFINDVLANTELPDSYKINIIYKDEYDLKKWTDNLLIEDIDEQIATQKALKKREDDALELRQLKQKLLDTQIKTLNTKYNLNVESNEVMYIDSDKLEQHFINKSYMFKQAELRAEQLAQATQQVQQVVTKTIAVAPAGVYNWQAPVAPKLNDNVYVTVRIGSKTQVKLDQLLDSIRQHGFEVTVL